MTAIADTRTAASADAWEGGSRLRRIPWSPTARAARSSGNVRVAALHENREASMLANANVFVTSGG